MLTYRYVYYVLCVTPGLFTAYALYDLSQKDITTRAWTGGATILMILAYSLFIAALGIPLIIQSWRKSLGVRGPALATLVAFGGWWYILYKGLTSERTESDAADHAPPPVTKPMEPAAPAMELTPEVDQPAADAQ